ncbi:MULTISPECIES: hypothetical protein [Streptomyces violaceusniger group]|uniref:Uncharacterized protein n=2 Tax=Streptomyces javensis TaxID=114698 RepID=A0ABS0RN31_9ACTN|nr:hypothetical protein [Streptomyces javensis]MBI0318829.1 hypothetical protein [Streptomyces javensis]
MPLVLNPLDAAQPLTAFGTAGVFLVLFAEAGLLIGFAVSLLPLAPEALVSRRTLVAGEPAVGSAK